MSDANTSVVPVTPGEQTAALYGDMEAVEEMRRGTAVQALRSVPLPQQTLQPLSARDVVAQVTLIQEVLESVMQPDTHYGKIPGCGDKPVLLKPGAETLCLTFRLAPRYIVTRHDIPAGGDIPPGHREYEIRCELYHITSGQFVGAGVGLCSTMETRYRYRKAERQCPQCGEATIIKGKKEYGGGWICFKKKGGCGAKFGDRDALITKQATGRTDNPDLADSYNTVLKMAKKRALVDATLTATAASDIFAQDLEDLPATDAPVPRAPASSAPSRPAAPSKTPAKAPVSSRSDTPVSLDDLAQQFAEAGFGRSDQSRVLALTSAITGCFADGGPDDLLTSMHDLRDEERVSVSKILEWLISNGIPARDFAGWVWHETRDLSGREALGSAVKAYRELQAATFADDPYHPNHP